MADRDIRFFISQAHDGSWCRVEDSRRLDWFAWLELDGHDEQTWFPPTYATPIPSNTPEGITFTNSVLLPAP